MCSYHSTTRVLPDFTFWISRLPYKLGALASPTCPTSGFQYRDLTSTFLCSSPHLLLLTVRSSQQVEAVSSPTRMRAPTVAKFIDPHSHIISLTMQMFPCCPYLNPSLHCCCLCVLHLCKRLMDYKGQEENDVQ